MWEAIRSNKRKSFWLIVLMALVLAALGAAIGSYLFTQNPEDGIFVGVLVAMIVWIIMLAVSFSSGDRILLATAGAREIKHDDAPQLYNIVEEMKIASGLPKMPRVFIIDNSVPNAFAVGIKPDRAAVAVTTGLMSRLNRDELQGVIAHEIAHISNRDTYFMTLAGVTVGAVIILADLFIRGMFYSSLSRGRRSSRDSGQLQLIIMVISIIVAILAPILTQLLYFACSRQREYLADAGSAQFTRYPAGLASALEKISQNQSENFTKSRTLAPMYIVNPLAATGKSNNLFSTHPSTEDRIRILRGMTSGSSLKAYEKAYQGIHGGSGILGKSTLQDSKDQGIRSAQTDKHEAKKSMRDVKDILHKAAGYGLLTCSCGVKMKIPKETDYSKVKCPRCGTVHGVPMEFLSAAAIAMSQKK
ncbi:MAG: M48 family metallopeptidase [Calditrichaceae bacterium]|nr:M48 family metallopeptidase [Calditrichaceae bacterium]HES59663.1 peptidase M28 [Caldithrix sp.]